MLFVPLPLFATFVLVFILIRMVSTNDMSARSNQLFAALVGLYALQSFMLCLRWGYGVGGAGIWIAMLAPVLPVVAYLAYLSLMDRLTLVKAWPAIVIAVNWLVLFVKPDLADGVILMTYLGFGVAVLWLARAGAGEMALVRIGQTVGVARAMVLTGLALIASAVVDLWVIFDFIRNGGQNVGLVVTLVQSGFLLCVGLAAFAGQLGATEGEMGAELSEAPEATEHDEAIIGRLTQLFDTDGLHLDTDLNLRRLSRRLGLPDRSVSQAVNRTQNMGVSQFVNSFRIKDACDLLDQTDQTILQVSLASGFLTKSNFNREFSRVTGRTPSQWRQSVGGNG